MPLGQYYAVNSCSHRCSYYSAKVPRVRNGIEYQQKAFSVVLYDLIKRKEPDRGYFGKNSLIIVACFPVQGLLRDKHKGYPFLFADIKDLFDASPYFKYTPPTPSCPISAVSVTGKDAIHIGRIKKEHSRPNSFWVWAVADNLTRGSALNAYEVAEEILSVESLKK